MTGSPPLHLALMLLAFLALGIPLVKLTSAPVVTMQAPVKQTADEAVSTLLRVRFAHTPQKLKLTQGDKVLFDGVPEVSTLELDVDLAIPKDGMELLVSATWPEQTPDTALTIELEPDGLDTRAETRWSTGPQLDEVMAFVWKK
jgi:hypothetical protein